MEPDVFATADTLFHEHQRLSQRVEAGKRFLASHHSQLIGLMTGEPGEFHRFTIMLPSEVWEPALREELAHLESRLRNLNAGLFQYLNAGSQS